MLTSLGLYFDLLLINRGIFTNFIRLEKAGICHFMHRCYFMQYCQEKHVDCVFNVYFGSGPRLPKLAGRRAIVGPFGLRIGNFVS
jgi:hypothetical protein